VCVTGEQTGFLLASSGYAKQVRKSSRSVRCYVKRMLRSVAAWRLALGRLCERVCMRVCVCVCVCLRFVMLLAVPAF